MSRHPKHSMNIAIALGLLGLILIGWGGLTGYHAATTANAPETQTPAPKDLKEAPAAKALNSHPDYIGSTMPAIISLVLLLAACAVLLRKHESSEHQRWATGTVTLIVGYWLR